MKEWKTGCGGLGNICGKSIRHPESFQKAESEIASRMTKRNILVHCSSGQDHPMKKQGALGGSEFPVLSNS